MYRQFGCITSFVACWDGSDQGRYHGGRRPSSDDSFHSTNRQCTISTRQIEYHEALPSSAHDEVRCDCTLADDGNASWYSICRVLMVQWRLDCEICRHLTVVGLHDTGPCSLCRPVINCILLRVTSIKNIRSFSIIGFKVTRTRVCAPITCHASSICLCVCPSPSFSPTFPRLAFSQAGSSNLSPLNYACQKCPGQPCQEALGMSIDTI